MVRKRPNRQTDSESLRGKAESRLRARKRDVRLEPARDSLDLVHELQVHQVELELQNEELRQTQTEVAESRDRHVALYDFAPVGYLTLDPSGAVLDANLTAAGMLGVERQTLLRLKFTQFVAAADRDRFSLHQNAVFRNDRKQTCELSICRADGREWAGRLEGISVADGATGGKKCYTAMIDISDRRRAEEGQRRTEERLRLALEGGRLGAWDWDLEKRESLWNPRMFELLGLRPQTDPVDSEAFFSRVFEEDGKALRLNIQTAIRSRGGFHHEFRIRRPDGTVGWIAATGRVFIDAGTKSPHLFGISYDITEQKQLEADLRQLNARVSERSAVAETRAAEIQNLVIALIRAQQTERDRLARLLHDQLQQLLVAAKMQLSLAGNRASKEKRANAIAATQELLDQSIDLTHSLSDQLNPPALKELGLSAALSWLARWMGDNQQLRVDLTVDAAAEPCEEAVKVLCFQTVRELLLNIVKHAGVKQAHVQVGADGGGNVRITVSDRGSGFDAADYGTTLAGRHGLGLFSISQQVRLIGGEFTIESAAGRGTTVRMRIPQHPVCHGSGTSAPAQPASQSKAAKIRLLLVDDHRAMREGLARALALEEDFEIIGEAEDGEAAIELARRLKPDAILMDITMPRLDGIAATKLILQQQPRVRVVGLSMHQEEDMRRSMIDAGAIAFLTKEGPVQDLIDTIRRSVRPSVQYNS